MLATAVRRGEAEGAEWREFDTFAKVWKIPPERTKATRGLELPLNAMALSCLGAERGTYVFSTTSGRKRYKAKARLDKAAGIESWHLHDLRRTVATNLGKLGVDRIVISKPLNHADGAVTAVYDRYGRDKEMVDAMEKWGDRLSEIVTGAPALRSL